MMDWTPLVAYGDEISVAGPGTAYVILYPLPDLGAAGTAEFLVEDDDSTQLYLERIVGEVYVSASVSPAAVAWQLMPLGVDYDAPAILSPFTADWSPGNTEWANLRWWARQWYYTDTDLLPSKVDHPAWTHVDIHPRQMMGRKRELWPVLCLYTSTGTTVRFRHYLRGLWKY